jgi:hypothetical protein
VNEKQRPTGRTERAEEHEEMGERRDKLNKFVDEGDFEK